MENEKPPQENVGLHYTSASVVDVFRVMVGFIAWIFFIFVAAPFAGCVVTFEASNLLPRTMFNGNEVLIFFLSWILVVAVILVFFSKLPVIGRKILRALSGNFSGHKE